MRISDWSSDMCSSDLIIAGQRTDDPGYGYAQHDKPRHRALCLAQFPEIEAKTAHEQNDGHGNRQGRFQQRPEHMLGIDKARDRSSDYACKQQQGDTWPSRSEEHTSELQSLMRISYAVFCVQKKNEK